MFSDLRRDVIARFNSIGGTVDHHCLNLHAHVC